jgi:hypothetical protein
MDDLDPALILAYTSFGQPEDRIAAFLTLRSEFLAQLPGELVTTDDNSIVWRLFQLGKNGELSTVQSPKV